LSWFVCGQNILFFVHDPGFPAARPRSPWPSPSFSVMPSVGVACCWRPSRVRAAWPVV